MIRAILVLLITLFANKLVSQKENIVFSYLTNDVASRIESRKEKFFYEYQDGVILEKQSFYDNIEKKYFYQKINQLDSIIIKETYDDTVFISKTIFLYNKNGLLLKRQRESDVFNEIVHIDSFIYDHNHLLDTLIETSNKVEEILGTKRINELILQSVYSFEYDQNQRLKRKAKVSGIDSLWTEYMYNKGGLLSQETESFGRAGGVCLVEEKELTSITTFEYNDRELLTRKTIQIFSKSQKGRAKKLVVRFRNKYKYYKSD